MGHKIWVDTKILKISTLLTLFKMEGNIVLPHKNRDNYYNIFGRGMILMSRSLKNKYRSVPVLFENPVCLSTPFYRSQLLTDFLLIILLFGVSPKTLGFGSPMRTFRKIFSYSMYDRTTVLQKYVKHTIDFLPYLVILKNIEFRFYTVYWLIEISHFFVRCHIFIKSWYGYLWRCG